MTYFNINTFFIGSSPFVTIYPMVALYLNYNELPPECQKTVSVSPFMLSIFLPVVFGFILSVVYKTTERFQLSKYTRIVLSGAVSAFIVSILLDYLKVYDQYLLVSSNTHAIHVFATLYYAAVFASIGKWLFRV